MTLPMLRIRPLVLLSTLIVASLAGCLGGDDPDVKVPTPDPDAGTGDNNTTLNGPYDAPVWQVGQWWAHHTYFGPDDKAGNHFNVLVTEAGSDYTVRSQSPHHARMDAEDDLFDLGSFSAELDTTWGGADWSWYDWPLEHNKTWQQTAVIAGAPYALTFRAESANDLRTAQGEKSGMRINATDANGTLLMTYDYVEELGWFSDLDIYDPSDPSQALFRIRNMGFGEGKTGDFFAVEIQSIVNETLTAVAGPATGGFTVPADTVAVTGRIVVAITTGQATLTITDPDGGTTEYTAAAPGGEEAATIDWEDPAPGDHSATLLGLGQDASALLDLTAVIETKGTV